MIDKIEEKLKQDSLNWKGYSEILSEDSSNFKRKFSQNIDKLNKWLEPLNLQVTIQEREEKKQG